MTHEHECRERGHMRNGMVLEGTRDPVTSGLVDRHDKGGMVDDGLMMMIQYELSPFIPRMINQCPLCHWRIC
jgi:hypothetical protein